ncbi:Eukaryotic translation initiation factor 3 subunit K [Strongyloides ratti]|uniref:Eukaryotic translation initiation factor 3 subunit K n=1 Tax=Strongyloides ratti TaxID=34506 RepID=A0A090L122_STRRB|nr:Eukaryotic translation initiation factor 3 subunit K [Strongyloides ratti]CEF61169.1 Eukaryotic translation initiation factor 3 subunit K [Strongyloides ratti]
MKPSEYARLKSKLDEEIVGINKYNPGNIGLLEDCIEAMINENKYDKNILLTTLKLYQLNTPLYNESIVRKILLKTMMVFPRNDYALASYLIDCERINTNDIKPVFILGEILETCNFTVFWSIMRGDYKKDEAHLDRFTHMAEIQKIVKSTVGFEDAVRRYVCDVINSCFQNINKNMLAKFLNVSLGKLSQYQKAMSWKENAENKNLIFIRNHEDNIKCKNIEEKLSFETVRQTMLNF